jgi:hypothetical protein
MAIDSYKLLNLLGFYDWLKNNQSNRGLESTGFRVPFEEDINRLIHRICG